MPMTTNRTKLIVLCGMLTLMLPWTAWPQNASSEQRAAGGAETKRERASSPARLESVTKERAARGKSESKPSLLDAARVSTEDARRGAAAGLANQDKAKAAVAKPSTLATEDSPVLEFHPAQATAAPSAPAIAVSKNSKKSPLKDLHGTAYGSTAAGTSNHHVGGSAGATSKSGKTSVYVETDQSRATSPH